MDFLGDFGLQDTFQGRIAPNSLQIDQDKLHIKFTALNVDFNGSSSQPFRFKETCAQGHQR